MKKAIFACGLWVLALNAQGQEVQGKHYVGVNLGGGLHTLCYKATDGNTSMGGGGLIQVQYQYWFNGKWGIGGGLGLSSLHSSAKYNYTNVTKNAIHPQANPLDNQYNCTTSFKDLKECQDMLNLDVTFQGFYRHPLSQKWSFQAGLGLSLNVPVSMCYKVREGSYNVTGYFIKSGTLIEDMPNHGFGEHASGEKGSIRHRSINVGVQVDLGTLYSLKEKSDLYLGLYANYQFISSVSSSTAEQFDAYTLSYTPSFNTREVDGVHPLEVGVKVGLRFRVGK